MSAEEWSGITEEISNLELLGCGLVVTRDHSNNQQEKSDTIGGNDVEAQNDEKIVAISESSKPIVKSVKTVQSPVKQRIAQYDAQQSKNPTTSVSNDSKSNDVLANKKNDLDDKVSVSGGSNDVNKDQNVSHLTMFREMMDSFTKSNTSIVQSVKGLLNEIHKDRQRDRLEAERHRKILDEQASKFVTMMEDVKKFMAQYEDNDEAEYQNDEIDPQLHEEVHTEPVCTGSICHNFTKLFN